VKQDGVYRIDLILFPVIESEIIEESQEEILKDEYFEESNDYLPLFILSIIVLMIIILIFVIRLKKEEKRLEKADDYLTKIVNILEREKRVTQKQIRKEVPLSEAKISLMISELESEGIVEKIKKGRGNILIYSGKKK
jgi:uncharacterized membrane protein